MHDAYFLTQILMDYAQQPHEEREPIPGSTHISVLAPSSASISSYYV